MPSRDVEKFASAHAARRGTAQPDAWAALNHFTDARIALGRTGGSWQTDTLLEFRLAHALARDAVVQTFEPESLAAGIRELGQATVLLNTAATSRDLFLQRPDL